MKKAAASILLQRRAAAQPVLKLAQIRADSKGFMIRGAMVSSFLPVKTIHSSVTTWIGDILNLTLFDETGLVSFYALLESALICSCRIGSIEARAFNDKAHALQRQLVAGQVCSDLLIRSTVDCV